MTTVEVLEKALKSFGPGGKRWARCPGDSQICALVAIDRADPRDEGFRNAVDALEKAIGGMDIVSWNDHPGRKFPEVKSAFLKAIELAKSEAGQ